jgi:2-polyprenyl-3-methyl-5-hydroxy-6-metoxy-1,4-benzoquinol methylase
MKTTVTAEEYKLADQKRMSRAKNYFAWQARLVKPELGRRVLEVGCGIGNFTHMLLDREAVLAIDIEPACVSELKRRFPGTSNVQAEVSADPAMHAAFRADSCVCLNVLEHIEDDRAALEAIADALVPGGVIALIVPAFPALYGPIDRNLGHYRRYTRSTLTQLSEAAHLQIRKAQYFNFVGFFAWWANAHLYRREAQSEAQIEFFDRYMVTVLSRLEAITPPPFGQSLFAVLKKP